MLMTYEQWLKLFKQQLKKYIKQKLYRLFYCVALFLILIVPPLAVIIHWLMTGY